MDCLLVDKFGCCFGFSLRSGGITVGCLGILFGILGITGALEDWHFLHFFAFGLIWTIPTSVITIIVFAIYLYGVFKERAWFMIPAIVWHSFSVALTTYLMLSIILMHGRLLAKIKTWIAILTLLIVAGILWYFILVSFSLFHKIKNRNNFDHEGIVYHTAEERSNLNQVKVQDASISPDTKFSS